MICDVEAGLDGNCGGIFEFPFRWNSHVRSSSLPACVCVGRSRRRRAIDLPAATARPRTAVTTVGTNVPAELSTRRLSGPSRATPRTGIVVIDRGPALGPGRRRLPW
ncbi:hypothetical protein EVAR_3193_1 [Eumeta japonica]|uniref:Uncharacterized protein n=1 Tax=Eumeta variegata TaxID=151549 RepID=A0A4C1SXA0_EUMVA|nr:hypothetical protein EVAR_3193_1 [Eumeta japonica]